MQQRRRQNFSIAAAVGSIEVASRSERSWRGQWRQSALGAAGCVFPSVPSCGWIADFEIASAAALRCGLSSACRVSGVGVQQRIGCAIVKRARLVDCDCCIADHDAWRRAKEWRAEPSRADRCSARWKRDWNDKLIALWISSITHNPITVPKKERCWMMKSMNEFPLQPVSLSPCATVA